MSPSSTIAHYRIVSKLGEGGMGEVWRATDTKLNRDVAIKILPESFAQDAARMSRFEREAQVLASLNHPNIAAIYGIEQGAIVMELVEGADLTAPVPIDTAIGYAKQIVAGLEAAHEKGIVHRDLKPANIKVTADGVVKLLDFGLAVIVQEGSGNTGTNACATQSPTLSLAMTQAGMILGTAAYMSPEQARGKPVDRRADIWAFGVIFYEMLTGAMLFGGGETVSDALAAVISREPDFNALPQDTPPRVRRLIERCLRKDPKLRLRDIGEARILLDEPEPEAPAPAPAAAPVVHGHARWWMAGRRGARTRTCRPLRDSLSRDAAPAASRPLPGAAARGRRLFPALPVALAGWPQARVHCNCQRRRSASAVGPCARFPGSARPARHRWGG
ncbi:putative Serine/threonine-protein kinase PknA [Candidatus Sulfopaludibacter sp. SbA4]|nr:putative Serine/threonine-protein kinase PknA [Candidatus Sulfopaludibacter sp. SbA4]